MGYTHYWKIENEIDVHNFEKIQKQTAIFCMESKAAVNLEIVSIGHKSALTPSIRIEGISDDGHETFYLENKAVSFDFCKTGEKAYDEIVVAVLIYASHFGLEWWSDGDDWKHIAGRVLYGCCGLPPAYNCSKSPTDTISMSKTEWSQRADKST